MQNADAFLVCICIRIYIKDHVLGTCTLIQQQHKKLIRDTNIPHSGYTYNRNFVCSRDESMQLVGNFTNLLRYAYIHTYVQPRRYFF